MNPKILMNAQPADGASNGAPSTGQSMTAAPPAQGVPQGADLSPLLEQFSKLIDSKLADQQNGIFANLRKAGVLGKAAKAEDTPTPAQPQQSDDVQAIITRERAFNRAISTVKLSDAQFGRMERAFQLEKPDDPSAWVKSWVSDLGIGQEAVVHQPSNPASTRSAHPVSDGGAPAPVSVPSDEIEPWRLSSDDVMSQLRRDGYAVAGARLREQYRRALRGRRIRLK